MVDWRLYLFFLGIFFSGIAGLHASSPAGNRPTVVFLLNEAPLNYEATKSIPGFAEELETQVGCEAKILIASGPNNRSSFEDTQSIRDADVLVIFCRRIALPVSQMKLIRDHYRAGKPVIGIRSANHAFSVRDSVAEGYIDWWDFVPEVLGCENRGHGPNPEPVKIRAPEEQPVHSWVKDASFDSWTSEGYLYRAYPLLDPHAHVIIEGLCAGQREPMAWTRISPYDGKVFYSALGEEGDFMHPAFRNLLTRAIHWSLRGNDPDK